MDRKNTAGLSRRSVLTTIAAATVTSGVVVANSDEKNPALPDKKKSFKHKRVKEYKETNNFISEVEDHASELLRGMFNDGYIDTPHLSEENLRIKSDGILNVSQKGEYGAWFRDGEPKLVVKLPSESHNVDLHIHPERGDVFANVDGEKLLKATELDKNDEVTTTGCDVCRTYVECTDTPCNHCYCNSCVEYGKKIGKEKFCCCSACGCTDCGYLAEEDCMDSCCNPCDGDECIEG